jgi:hypothetical protein
MRFFLFIGVLTIENTSFELPYQDSCRDILTNLIDDTLGQQKIMLALAATGEVTNKSEKLTMTNV